MTFNIFTAGTKAKASEVNANFNSLTKLHGEIVANDVTATESQILASSSLKIVDKFLDSNGQNNTYGIIWDVGSAVYTQSFDVSAKETAPTGLTFKPDGSQMYIIGIGSDAVHNYTLSTAWDISTASFTRSFSVADKDTGSNGVTFKTDGTTMYMIGSTGDLVYQYDLGTSTVAYEATNKYVYCSGTTYTDSILVSHATTIPASQTKVFCVPLMYEALTGSDNITFDVSINGGTNYTTGIAKNTWSAITSTTGTSLVVKMNLDTASGASTPKVSGWAIFTE